MEFYVERLTKKNSENDTLKHYGIKGQKWDVRRYQDEDGNLTDEGRERYRKMQKERQAFKNSDEAKRNKQIARMKSSADKKALSKAAKISQDIAHKIRLEEEQNGRSVVNMYTEEVDDAVQCVMSGLLLWQYEMFNPGMSAVVRVGDDYVRGSYGEIESRFRALISSGKDISDIELISVDPMAKTVYDVDKNGRITNEWKLGDDEINRNKKRREQTNK